MPTESPKHRATRFCGLRPELAMLYQANFRQLIDLCADIDMIDHRESPA